MYSAERTILVFILHPGLRVGGGAGNVGIHSTIEEPLNFARKIFAVRKIPGNRTARRRCLSKANLLEEDRSSARPFPIEESR